MDNFSMNVQVEELCEYDDRETLDSIMRDEENEFYERIKKLARIGQDEGFDGGIFLEECRKAFKGFTEDQKYYLSTVGVKYTKDFASFVVGFAYSERFFNLF